MEKHDLLTSLISADDPVHCLRELTRMILAGTIVEEFRKDPKKITAMVMCAFSSILFKLMELLGHDDLQVWSTANNEFLSACDELAEACNCRSQRIMAGPLVNSIIAALLNELLKRLPDLLDALIDQIFDKPDEPEIVT